MNRQRTLRRAAPIAAALVLGAGAGAGIYAGVDTGSNHAAETTTVVSSVPAQAAVQTTTGPSLTQIYKDATPGVVDITVNTTTTVDNGVYKRVVTESRSWPLTIDYAFNSVTDGYAQITSVDQGLQRTVDFGLDGFGSHEATLNQHMVAADTLLFDASGNATGRTDQSSAQTFTYLDPYGACYDRTITTDTGVLATVTDGTACPDGVNTLDSFDSFHNAGSLTFGATLQILP